MPINPSTGRESELKSRNNLVLPRARPAVDYASYNMASLMNISDSVIKEKGKDINRERKFLRDAIEHNTGPQGNRYIL